MHTEAIKICDNGELGKLEQYIEESLDYNNIPAEYFGNILLAVRESAELFLRKKERENPIKVNIKRTKRGITFEIRGGKEAGDDTLDDLDKAINTHRIMKEAFIIRSLADETEIRNEGKTLMLHFFVTGINYERALSRAESIKKYWTRKQIVMDKNES